MKFKDWAETQNTIELLTPASFHLLTRFAREAEWSTRRDIWGKSSQVYFISVAFKSNLISVGRIGVGREGVWGVKVAKQGPRKKGEGGQIESC